MLTERKRHGQTDRLTDGQTDGTTYDSNTALALRASRGKNEVVKCRRTAYRALMVSNPITDRGRIW